MAWDFTTEPEFQEKLDWMDAFVRDEVEPLDLVWGDKAFHPLDDTLRAIVDPLKQQVRDRGLWACHLGPELGGEGYGQVKLSLMNEILGRIAVGADRLRHPGARHRQRRDHRPLRDRRAEGALPAARCSTVRSSRRYSMTEPQGGSDPTRFTTQARRDGDEWVLDGWKFFSSNARTAVLPHRHGRHRPRRRAPTRGCRCSWSRRTPPGWRSCATSGSWASPCTTTTPGCTPSSTTTRSGCRPTACSAGEGQAFAIAQTRLGGGRIHHAMRTVGMCQKALDMMCERALSRETQGGLLADKQSVQNYVADSYIQLMQFRLFVLYVAWEIDQYQRLPRGSATTSPPSRCSPRRCCTTSCSGPSRCTGRWGSPTRCRWARCG